MQKGCPVLPDIAHYPFAIGHIYSCANTTKRKKSFDDNSGVCSNRLSGLVENDCK